MSHYKPITAFAPGPVRRGTAAGPPARCEADG
jgi:hypothetical protein